MLFQKFFWIFILFLLILNYAEGGGEGKDKKVEQIPSNTEAEKGEIGNEKQKGKEVEVVGKGNVKEKEGSIPPKTRVAELDETSKAPNTSETGKSSRMATTAQASGGAPKTYASVLSQPPKPIKKPGTVSNMTSLKSTSSRLLFLFFINLIYKSGRTNPVTQRQTPPLNTSKFNKPANLQQGRMPRVQQGVKIIVVMSQSLVLHLHTPYPKP